MGKRLFGTDGVRGVANRDLTPELATALGLATGAFMHSINARGSILLGWDTRLSSTMLKSAFAAGCCGSGLSVVEADTVPTGVLAYFTKEDGYALGAMVSASHNPANDNGIKLIGPDGRKLRDEQETEIEALLGRGPVRAEPAELGVVSRAPRLRERHRERMAALFPARLDGMRILVDCAHGAATGWIAPVLRFAGAEVHEIGVSPDGLNINAEGGATKPSFMQAATRERGCDLGMAFDGDADRVVFSDENGRLVNGDTVMAIWAGHRKRRSDLDPPVVVGTIMSNAGFEEYLRSEGIDLLRAPVGDRYVVEKMDEVGALIGGEQSGHIIFPELAPTGDGILTAMELLSLLGGSGRPLSEVAGLYEPWPQVLFNVAVPKPEEWCTDAVGRAIEEAEQAVAGGRLNVRASGTQEVVRVMCEHKDRKTRDAAAEMVIQALCDSAGGEISSKVELTDALGD
jgi:phosphoglucosamine mutase